MSLALMRDITDSRMWPIGDPKIIRSAFAAINALASGSSNGKIVEAVAQGKFLFYLRVAQTFIKIFSKSSVPIESSLNKQARSIKPARPAASPRRPQVQSEMNSASSSRLWYLTAVRRRRARTDQWR